MSQVKKVLESLTFPSTELDELTFADEGLVLRIRFTHEDETGARGAGGIEFKGVRAFRHRAESHCTVWHIEDAYDALVEVEASEWVAELLEAMPEDMRGMFEMHHYMIYFDSYGSYEVVAESWRFLPGVTAK